MRNNREALRRQQERINGSGDDYIMVSPPKPSEEDERRASEAAKKILARAEADGGREGIQNDYFKEILKKRNSK